ncbi:MAG: hypothetical protein AVDCRST_MAG55-1750, partial [uncultured Rubrobacteraceae bacterium]
GRGDDDHERRLRLHGGPDRGLLVLRALPVLGRRRPGRRRVLELHRLLRPLGHRAGCGHLEPEPHQPRPDPRPRPRRQLARGPVRQRQCHRRAARGPPGRLPRPPRRASRRPGGPHRGAGRNLPGADRVHHRARPRSRARRPSERRGLRDRHRHGALPWPRRRAHPPVQQRLEHHPGQRGPPRQGEPQQHLGARARHGLVLRGPQLYPGPRLPHGPCPGSRRPRGGRRPRRRRHHRRRV